jgi:hypothetical protein
MSLLACTLSNPQQQPQARQDCVHNTCALSINYPYDAVGEVDNRPGTWGRTAADDGRIQFHDVPAGYRVRIERVYGNFTARVHGPAPRDTYAGALFGLITTGTAESPFATLSSYGCMLYLQLDVGPGQAKVAPFDVKTHASGLLESDNVLLVRRAIYLNETEASIHLEPSLVVEFTYEQSPPGM